MRVHPVLEQVHNIAGAQGIVGADKRRIHRARDVDRLEVGRIGGHRPPERIGADRQELVTRIPLGVEIDVEVGRDGIHQVELVRVVAGEVGRRCAAAAEFVDGGRIDHAVHEIGEDQVEGAAGVFGAERIHQLLAEAAAQRGVIGGHRPAPGAGGKEHHFMPQVEQRLMEIAQPRLVGGDSGVGVGLENLKNAHNTSILPANRRCQQL
jgi:hypothetical protein